MNWSFLFTRFSGKLKKTKSKTYWRRNVNWKTNCRRLPTATWLKTT